MPAWRAGLTGQAEARLELINLRPEGFGTVKAQVPLWPFDAQHPSLPALAVAPNGRHLAVAGSPDRAVAVYALADLLQGRANPQQLRGDGVTFGQVAFVKQDADWGLRLGEPAKDRPGAPGRATARDLIFDFAQESADGRPGGVARRTPPRPARGGWTKCPQGGTLRGKPSRGRSGCARARSRDVGSGSSPARS